MRTVPRKPRSEDKENYKSAKLQADSLRAQFEDEVTKRWMMKLPYSAAREKWHSRLVVAALAALEKSDGTLRVVHDGTHGVRVNPRIRNATSKGAPAAARDVSSCGKTADAEEHTSG